MAHEHDADASAFQVADELDQGIDLVACQRCGWLIHNEEFGIRCQCTADRHELTSGNAEIGDLRFRIEFNADLRHRGHGGHAHRGPVDPAQAAKMVAHRDVLGDSEVGEEREILIDDLDAAMRGADRIQFWIFLAGNDDPAASFRRLDAGNDLYKCRLAGAVLADKAVHLADLQRQIDIAKRMHATEALRNAGHLQESHQGFVLR